MITPVVPALSNLELIELEGDAMIACLIAVHYSAYCLQCPVKMFGAHETRAFVDGFPFGSDVWYASGRDQIRTNTGSGWSAGYDAEGERVSGVTVTRAIDKRNGGEDQQVWWFPFDSLKDVKFQALGVRVR